MREIKFRAWDEGKKVMHYDFQFFTSGEAGNDWICFSSDKEARNTGDPRGIIFNNPYFRQQLKIMQFTGLRDRNGKEIYEGDVVKQNACYSESSNTDFSYDMTYIGVVRVEASKGAVLTNITCTDNIDSGIFKVKHRKGIAGYRAEVIGNIHETPELLEAPCNP